MFKRRIGGRRSSDDNMNKFLVKAVLGLLGARVCLIGFNGVWFLEWLRCVAKVIQLAISLLRLLINNI